MVKTRSILMVTSVCMLAFTAANANAQTAPVPVPQTSHATEGAGGNNGGGHHHSGTGAKNTNPACRQIQADCREAGYIVGQWKKDNGLWKDCFDRIMKGETPTRYGKPDPMNINQNTVQECKGAMGHHHGGGHKGGNAPQTEAPAAAR